MHFLWVMWNLYSCVLLKYTRTLIHAMSVDPLKKQSVFLIFLHILIFPFSSKDLHAFKLQKLLREIACSYLFWCSISTYNICIIEANQNVGFTSVLCKLPADVHFTEHCMIWLFRFFHAKVSVYYSDMLYESIWLYVCPILYNVHYREWD